MKKEVVLKGLSISNGITIGLPYYLFFGEKLPVEETIAPTQVEKEIIRYREALQRSRQEVEELQKNLLKENAGLEVAQILDTHLEMLKDPVMTVEMEEKIRQENKKPETVFCKTISEFQDKFICFSDTFFQERVKDITDVSKRILGHLSSKKRYSLPNFPKNSLLIAYEMIPSIVAAIDSSCVLGIVTESGGNTSHAAIIARAKGLPYIGGIDIATLKRLSKKEIILDGTNGLVIINPTAKTLKTYILRSLSDENFSIKISKERHLPAQTLDKVPIELFGNIENLEDIDLLLDQEAAGIGLFRSEYLFLEKKGFPSEEEQFEIYKKILLKMKGKPVVIRVFDIGADKRGDLFYARMPLEHNPALGCRAIRFLLKHRELFERQLKALIRASQFGDIRILLPMITDLSEVVETRKILKNLKGDKIPLGCMIEVPSSAILSDPIAEVSDFLSIGTNDLIQYVLASDRSNPAVSFLYSPAHPSILYLLQQIIHVAGIRKKELLICGESAADTSFLPILLGLGVRKFSVAPRHLAIVKHTLRHLKLEEAEKKAKKALSFTSFQELHNYLYTS